jgi:hypothetical protein
LPTDIMPDYWQPEEVWCPLLTSDPILTRFH